MKLLKVGFICLIAMTLLLSSFNTLNVFASTENLDSSDVEAFLDGIMQEKMEEFHIANATVSVVADGEVVLAKGYGYADLDNQEPVDAEHTLFRIGSTSKLFTWTAVMQLVEQGKLDLDTDVNDYLDFEIPDELEYKTQGSSEFNAITLKHLMSHTPGFEDYSSEIFKLSEDQMVPLDEYLREKLPARIFPAGEVIAYSNYGTALAGYVVEQVSGMPFAEYVETHIYAPLGMEHSTFRQPIPENLDANITKAYRYVDGDFLEGEFEFIPPEPAGSMSSSAHDMAQFMLAFLQEGEYDGEKILEKDTVQKMFGQLYSPHQNLQGMAHGFIEGIFNEKRTVYHPGNTMLFNTGFYLLPEELIGIFISHSGGSYLANNEVFQAFMDHYFPVGDVETFLPTDGMLERSKKFKGEYQQNRKSLTTEDKFLSLLTGVISIDVDDDGYLMVTHLGETDRFMEVEPGVYHNLEEGRSQDPAGAFQNIIFGTDPFGKIMLMTDGPMSYSKADWYESGGFNFILIILSILFIIGSLFYWGIKSIIQRFRGKKTEQASLALTAKGLAIIYGLLTIVFLIDFMSTGNLHPIYQLPPTAYGETSPWSAFTVFIPYLMIIISLAIAIFTVLAWWKKFWQKPGRIHYSLFAGATMALLWIFVYWNVI